MNCIQHYGFKDISGFSLDLFYYLLRSLMFYNYGKHLVDWNGRRGRPPFEKKSKAYLPGTEGIQ